MWYECIKLDTFGKLKLGKLYYIENYIIYNDDGVIPMYHLSLWQLETMFKEIE